MARECPKRGKLATMIRDEEETGETRLGALKMLGSIKARKSNKKGLMFVDVKIAGQSMSALVDTGATDLFISEEAAKKVGLKVEKRAGWLKTVNSKEVPTFGMARDVDVQIGLWSSKEAIEVIPLDDYDFVIGLDFLAL